ncbi:MAG: hypothetical protein P8098_12465, partial [Candidatus Thiodiazotropha sp.]
MLKRTAVFFLFIILSGSASAGVIGVRAHIEPGENFNDVVGIRYKLRMDENIFESTAKIIFNASRFYNPENYPSRLYSAIETNFINYLAKLPDGYVDLGCVTFEGCGYLAGTLAREGLGL